jgi:hypothetical protein
MCSAENPLGPEYKAATRAKDKDQNSNNTSQYTSHSTAAEQLRSNQNRIHSSHFFNKGAQKLALVMSNKVQNTPHICLG